MVPPFKKCSIAGVAGWAGEKAISVFRATFRYSYLRLIQKGYLTYTELNQISYEDFVRLWFDVYHTGGL